MEKYTRDTLLGDLLKDPKAVEVIDKHLPGVLKNPALKLVQKFTLEKLTSIPQTGLTSETLDAMLADINQ